MINLIRNLVGFILKMLDRLTSPTPIKITDEQKQLIVSKVKGHELYIFPLCPFCLKVTRFMKKNNIDLPLRNARQDENFRVELFKEGGKLMAPCLKITEKNSVRWLYESDDIILYLKKSIS